MEKATGSPHLIDFETAVSVTMNCKWAIYRRDRNKRPISQSEMFLEAVHGKNVHDPRYEATKTQYEDWCARVVKAFIKDTERSASPYYEAATIDDAGILRIRESALQEWLDDKWTQELMDKFGPIE
nr:hypothetical protein GCM10011355_08060 [Aquisalinus luteolus]